MRKHVRYITAVASPKGDVEAINKAIDYSERNDGDALAILGDLTHAETDSTQMKEIFASLGKANIPSYFVPGVNDYPIATYLKEAYNIELVYPSMHGVHGTFAFAPGHILFGGMGGRIVTEASKKGRDELESLQYNTWEVEYRLKILREIKDYPQIFLFSTIPETPSVKEEGNEELATLIKTHNPHLVISGGTNYYTGMVGKTWLVNPGSITENKGAFIDLRERKSEPIEL